LNWSF